MATYNGDNTNNVINGSSADDIIYGNDGNDTLNGGADDWQNSGIGDRLHGGAGDDTYLFGAGSGHDTVSEDGNGGVDKVVFTGLNKADVAFQKVDTYSLTATIKSTGESIYITNGFHPDTNWNVESFVFNDGILTLAAVNLMTLTGGTGNDTVWGWTGNDTVSGLAGDDTLYGMDGNDTLDGGADDWLISGVGDRLHGGSGNDTYLFGAGSGHDTVSEDGNGGVDKVVFTGLNMADVAFQKLNTYDLQATIKSTGESIYITNEFHPDTNWNVESFVFNDGTLTQAAVNLLTITGGTGKDTVWGWTGNDTVSGLAGDDTLYGMGGNDTLDGGADDWQNSGIGDRLHGGAGDDTYLFGAGSGHDTVSEDGNGGVDKVVFTGLNKADVDFQKVDTYSLQATIKSTGESIYITNGFHPDTNWNVESFVFNDGTLTKDQTLLLHQGGAGDDILYGGTGNDSIYGAAGNDLLIDNSGGNDLLDGGAGIDIMIGGTGNDTYVVDNVGDVVVETSTLATEIDTVNSAITYTLGANLENLTLTGADAINGTGNALNNVLTGNSAANTLDGGVSDTYNPGVTDTLSGGAGNDTFLARGFYGHGVYDGGDGTDTLDFSQADAWTAARRAADGAGVDVDLAAGLASTYYLKAAGFTWADAVGQIQLANIENLIGTGQADRLAGDANANTLDGGAGNDRLDGGVLDAYASVTDILKGGAGDDTFLVRGIYGHGVYDGGDGSDTLDFSQADAYTAARRAGEGAGVDVDLSAGLASTYFLKAAGFTWVDPNGQIQTANIENLVGTGQSDRLVGDAHGNTLDGGVLDAYASIIDTLAGGAGDDTFLARGIYGHGVYDGGDGTDTLDFSQADAYTAARRAADGAGVDVDLSAGLASTYYLKAAGFTWADPAGQIQLANIENLIGSGQADRLVGDANANVLQGGGGADSLTGGAGADTFKLNALADSGPTAALRDVIQDFLSAQGDKLDLSALDADETLAGDQPFLVLTQGAGFAGVFAGPASLYFDQTEHVLYGNVNADGAADFSIQLVGVSSLSFADLVA